MTNPLLSNFLWLAFFPVRAISTLAQNAFVTAYVSVIGIFTTIFVLLKFETGFKILWSIVKICNWVTKCFPSFFLILDFDSPEEQVKTGDISVSENEKQYYPPNAIKWNIAYRAPMCLVMICRLCLFTLFSVLITSVSIVQVGARAMFLIGNGLCAL
ncbi:MAG: hypothetical protein LBC42_02715 [Puniceicoccales bacterium]|nr:hypothetical protein [Puniceicoccales bacterium]